MEHPSKDPATLGTQATPQPHPMHVQKSEEWDGGSRGKVYTKGKRGKGFH